MSARFTPEFRRRFHAAFLNYEAGEWATARESLMNLGGALGDPGEEEDIWKRLGRTIPSQVAAQILAAQSSSVKSAGPEKDAGENQNMASLIDNIKDGPSKCLLKFMQGYDFQAPNGWAGYRNLEI